MEIRILGPLEVVVDGRPLVLGGPRQRALLAILALHANELVSRDRLIDEIWGDEPRKQRGPRFRSTSPNCGRHWGETPSKHDRAATSSKSARASSTPTSSSSSSARPAARRPLLRPSGYARPSDSGVVRRSRTSTDSSLVPNALGWKKSGWRHSSNGSSRPRAWCQSELVPELEGLVREHPLRERLRGQLMLALYRCGRQADALEVYRHGRRLLDEELGIEPGEELRRLEKGILTQDPVLAAPPPSLPERLLDAAGRRRRALVLVGALLLASAAAGAIIRVTVWQDSAVAVLPNSVAVVDTKMRIVADVPVGSGPVAVATGGGAVWAANGGDGTVSRIDPDERKVVATIGIGGEVSDLAFGYGAIWVAGGSDETLTRIDPGLNAVEARLTFGRSDPLSPRPMFAVATGAHAVWVTRGNHVLRIDPDTNEATADIPIDRPRSLVVGAGSVWITTASERILRVEPSTGAVTATIPVPAEAYASVASRGTLWSIVGIGGGEIWRFDADTGEPTGTIRVGRLPVGLALSGDTLWAATILDVSLTRIDAATGHVDDTVRIGQRPSAIAAGEGAVWVAVGTRATR